MEKEQGMGPNPSEEQHPPSWGFLPLAERGPLVWGRGCTNLEESWALHGSLQQEGADLYISHQPCPHLQMPQSQLWLLPVWFQGKLSIKAGALSPIKSIIAFLGVQPLSLTKNIHKEYGNI